MSHYRKVATQITNGGSLIAALQSLKLNPIAAQNLQENTVQMQNGFDRTQVAVLVSAHDLFERNMIPYDHLTGYGVGFTWDAATGTYSTTIDGYDAGRLAEFNQRLIQTYGVIEATRLVSEAGYSVMQSYNPDGSIVLTATQY